LKTGQLSGKHHYLKGNSTLSGNHGLKSTLRFIQSHTLHESGNLGEIKKMFADEIFALQKSILLQYTRLLTIFADLGQTKHILCLMLSKNTKSFRFTENGVDLGRTNAF